jgi:hypothetical protein
MKHKDLIEIGFRLCGVEENDPYYKLTYRPPFNFNISSLSGVLSLSGVSDEGLFWLYGNDKRYSDKNELKEMIKILGNEVYIVASL